VQLRRLLKRGLEHHADALVTTEKDFHNLPECLADIKPQLLSGLPEAGRAAFEADAEIARGGCLIETDGGEVDARIERQFQVVEEAFRVELDKETARLERAV
jgi:hypothetical protein